jgi:hypothetical protein
VPGVILSVGTTPLSANLLPLLQNLRKLSELTDSQPAIRLGGETRRRLLRLPWSKQGGRYSRTESYAWAGWKGPIVRFPLRRSFVPAPFAHSSIPPLAEETTEKEEVAALQARMSNPARGAVQVGSADR